MEKIKVDVCVGTTCFVMGGANLQELQSLLPRKYGEQVDVSCIPCLELCSISDGYSKAPFVKVNNEVIDDASIEKVVDKINGILNK